MTNLGNVVSFSVYMERKPSPVTLLYSLGMIECKGCKQRIPLSRATLRDQLKVTEELAMAAEVHEDCVGLESGPATLRRTWREGLLREKYRIGGDRLAYSV